MEQGVINHISIVDTVVFQLVVLFFGNSDLRLRFLELFGIGSVVVLLDHHHAGCNSECIGKIIHHDNHCRQEDEHIQKIDPAQCAQPRLQCLAEKLAPVLGQVFFPEIAFPALSVVIVVHHFPEHDSLSLCLQI